MRRETRAFRAIAPKKKNEEKEEEEEEEEEKKKKTTTKKTKEEGKGVGGEARDVSIWAFVVD